MLQFFCIGSELNMMTKSYEPVLLTIGLAVMYLLYQEYKYHEIFPSFRNVNTCGRKSTLKNNETSAKATMISDTDPYQQSDHNTNKIYSADAEWPNTEIDTSSESTHAQGFDEFYWRSSGNATDSDWEKFKTPTMDEIRKKHYGGRLPSEQPMVSGHKYTGYVDGLQQIFRGNEPKRQVSGTIPFGATQAYEAAIV